MAEPYICEWCGKEQNGNIKVVIALKDKDIAVCYSCVEKEAGRVRRIPNGKSISV